MCQYRTVVSSHRGTLIRLAVVENRLLSLAASLPFSIRITHSEQEIGFLRISRLRQEEFCRATSVGNKTRMSIDRVNRMKIMQTLVKDARKEREKTKQNRTPLSFLRLILMMFSSPSKKDSHYNTNHSSSTGVDTTLQSSCQV